MINISIDPVAFAIGSHEVRWYGIIVALAVVAVVLWAYHQISRIKETLTAPPDIMLAPVGIASGIAGAKLVHVLEKWQYYVQHPAEIFSGGGLAIYGGVIGATLGIWIYLRFSSRGKERVRDFFSVADLIAPGIILAQAIGRVGCLVNGCCFGLPAADWLPWSVVYTHPNSYAPLNIPLHPTQVYETIFALVCFVILLRLTGRLKPAGSVFLVYFIMYSAWRIGIGFLRDATVYFAFGLSQAQILSIVVLAASVFILIYRRRRFREEEKSSG